MAKIFFITLTLGLLTSCSKTDSPEVQLPDGMTLVEQLESSPDGLQMAYRKYQLENGLTLLIHEDHSDPLVHVNMTYHVGSSREEYGKSGFAHFFEHMMFQGSENVANLQHFKMVNEAGGSMNGTTNRDRTNYYETVPANQLERMLWLEADRMGWLLQAVDQKKFETQRSVVKQERAQNYDNRPYGLLSERVGEALYPREHPYAAMPIGYVEDLDRVNVNDLKDFFLRWYGPGNAVLSIGGDFDLEQTLEWVVKYFAPIPAAPQVKPMEPMPVTLESDRYISMEDQISLPLLFLSYPTVYLKHPDADALSLVTFAFGNGESSFLHERLVKTQLAVQAAAWQTCDELACTFSVYVMPNPKKPDLKPLLAEVDKAIQDFQITEQDLQRMQGIIEADTIWGLQSVSGKIEKLSEGLLLEGDPNATAQSLYKLKDVSVEQVQELFDQYVKNNHRVVMSMVPRGKLDLRAAEDNYQPEPRVVPEVEPMPEVEPRKIVDRFDRSVVPEAGDNPMVTVPPLWKSQFKGDIELLGAINDETPTVSIKIFMRAGRRLETTEQLGLSELTAAMLEKSTQVRSSQEINGALDELGSSINFTAGIYGITATVESLTKHLPKTLEILQEMLFMPAFTGQDFEQVRTQQLESLNSSKQRPQWLAQLQVQRLLHGKESPRGNSRYGTEALLRQYTVDDVKAWYDNYINLAGARIVVVGDIQQENAERDLKFLEGGVKGEMIEYPPMPKVPEWQGQKVFLIDRPGAVQSVMYMARPALPYDALGEQFQLGLMNFNLGGNFNSRLNQTLREEKGYTYGVNSQFIGGREDGYFLLTADVQADSTLAAMQDTDAQIELVREKGFSEDELGYMRSSISQREALSYETLSQKGGFLQQMQLMELPEDFVVQQNQLIQEVTLDELQQLSVKWLQSEDLSYIVVGDQANLKPQLEQAGYQVELVTFD